MVGWLSANGATSSLTVASPLREPRQDRPPGRIGERGEDEVEIFWRCRCCVHGLPTGYIARWRYKGGRTARQARGADGVRRFTLARRSSRCDPLTSSGDFLLANVRCLLACTLVRSSVGIAPRCRRHPHRAPEGPAERGLGTHSRRALQALPGRHCFRATGVAPDASASPSDTAWARRRRDRRTAWRTLHVRCRIAAPAPPRSRRARGQRA